jgi:4-hydroxybenzoate polyprenyltransferase
VPVVALKAKPIPAVAPEIPPPSKYRDAPLSYRLSRRLSEYGLLMRLDRPVGTWLLLWPALWALWIAGAGRPKPRVLIVFVLGVIVMRAAGCVINDLADRDIDPHVRRTRDRPLAARRVSPPEALVLFTLLAAAALYLVTRLDLFTVKLACIGALLTVSYPFLKRFFPVPQLYLGLSFGGWSVPMAFAAQTGALPRVAWLLYIAAVIWTSAYDTIYAMVDREDDLAIGVKSSAILFADLDRVLIGGAAGADARRAGPGGTQHALRAASARCCSIKTGGCPEDCAYCPQSAALRHRRRPPQADAGRRGPREARARQGRRRHALLHGRGLAQPEGPRPRPVCEMVRGVRALGLETCATLGMLTAAQARRLKATPASTTTTTTSTPRRSSTARSSPRAPTRTGSTRSPTCATPA